MNGRIIRDKYGTRMGEIEIDSTGMQTARDVHGNVAGTYDPRTNTTRDKYGNCFGEGNLLASLVGPQRHNAPLWGTGGFLLGSSLGGGEIRYGRESREATSNSTYFMDALQGLCGSAALVALIISIWSVVKDHSEFPAKQIAAIYYYGAYGALVPLACIIDLPWQYICTQPLTDYPNLNMALAVAAIIAIVALIFSVFGRVFRALPKITSLLRIFFGLFLFGPWLFWWGWVAYKWLSAPAQ